MSRLVATRSNNNAEADYNLYISRLSVLHCLSSPDTAAKVVSRTRCTREKSILPHEFSQSVTDASFSLLKKSPANIVAPRRRNDTVLQCCIPAYPPSSSTLPPNTSRSWKMFLLLLSSSFSFFPHSVLRNILFSLGNVAKRVIPALPLLFYALLTPPPPPPPRRQR